MEAEAAPWCRTGKACYVKHEAIEHAQVWRELDGQPWRAYPCVWCQSWHITSHLRRRKRR